jgi:thymidylate synthase (FAD)
MANKEINILDKGFIRLIDHMGDDDAVVQAARVSYGKGTKTVNEDRGLIRYLIRHRHTTPLEMVVFKFHIKSPIFVARQWIRHRASSTNEYSGRYSEMSNEFYLPDISRLSKQSDNNKQGSSDEIIDDANNVHNEMEDYQLDAYSHYKDLLDSGLSRELSRINLPLSNYTEWYWKIDLHNLMHFLKLRMDSHAQYEIRVYANAIVELIKDIVPVSMEAFDDYILNGVSLSRMEVDIIKNILMNNLINLDEVGNNILSGREKKEFISKFTKKVIV